MASISFTGKPVQFLDEELHVVAEEGSGWSWGLLGFSTRWWSWEQTRLNWILAAKLSRSGTADTAHHVSLATRIALAEKVMVHVYINSLPYRVVWSTLYTPATQRWCTAWPCLATTYPATERGGASQVGDLRLVQGSHPQHQQVTLGKPVLGVPWWWWDTPSAWSTGPAWLQSRKGWSSSKHLWSREHPYNYECSRPKPCQTNIKDTRCIFI